MLTPSLLVFVAFLTMDLTQAIFCVRYTQWNNNNHTCPPKAVCGQVIERNTLLENGTSCLAQHTVHECLCGSRPCPINNRNHQMYDTPNHRIYICEHFCSKVDYCQSNRAEFNNSQTIAVTTHHYSREFHWLSFDRLECRCRRHHFPSYLGTATTMLDFNAERTTYKCRYHTSDDATKWDPCVCPPKTMPIDDCYLP